MRTDIEPAFTAEHMLKLTKAEAQMARDSVEEGHPVARFLDRTPPDDLGRRTAAFRKIAAAANAQVAATKAILRLEQQEGYVVSLDTLRARVNELLEANYQLLEAAEQDAAQIEELQLENAHFKQMVVGMLHEQDKALANAGAAGTDAA